MTMTRLEMAVNLRVKVQGAGSGPTSTLNQVGEYARIVDAIDDANDKILRSRDDWKFMYGTFTLNTVASDGAYSASDCIVPVTNLRAWDDESLNIYLLSAGVGAQSSLQRLDYEDWYRSFNTGSQSTGRPVYFTVGNADEILLGPLPDDVYRISGEYRKSITRLAADADTPPFPGEFHMAVVYEAMRKYGVSTGAPELIAEGTNEYNMIISDMERTQVRPFRYRRAFA